MSNETVIKQTFTVGQEVQVGTVEHLPTQSDIPWPGRVICIDASNPQKLTVLALIRKSLKSTNETIMQFSFDGKCLLAMHAGELGSPYYDANLYPVKQPK